LHDNEDYIYNYGVTVYQSIGMAGMEDGVCIYLPFSNGNGKWDTGIVLISVLELTDGFTYSK
jgi:hypothetical protein